MHEVCSGGGGVCMENMLEGWGVLEVYAGGGGVCMKYVLEGVGFA